MNATVTMPPPAGTSGAAAPPAAQPAFRRWTMFVHRDGVLLGPTLRAPAELRLLEPSLAAERSVADMYSEVTARGFEA